MLPRGLEIDAEWAPPFLRGSQDCIGIRVPGFEGLEIHAERTSEQKTISRRGGRGDRDAKLSPRLKRNKEIPQNSGGGKSAVVGDEHPEVERTSCCDGTRNTIVSIPTAGFTRESECHWTRDHVFSLFFVAVSSPSKVM